MSRPGLSWPLCRDCDFSKALPCFSVSLESWCNLLWPCNAHTLCACDTIWITLINSAARERHSRELSRHFWGGIYAPKWLNLENHYLVCLIAKQANKQKASQGFLLSLSHFNWIFIFTDWRLWWGNLAFPSPLPLLAANLTVLLFLTVTASFSTAVHATLNKFTGRTSPSCSFYVFPSDYRFDEKQQAVTIPQPGYYVVSPSPFPKSVHLNLSLRL